MDKKIIVLAVATAISAPVFAADDSKITLSVYGILDAGYGSVSKTVTQSPTNVPNPSGTAKYEQSAFEYSAMQSSRLGFLATEEMANGTKATLRVETGISSNPMTGFSQTGAGAPSKAGTTIDATTLGNRELNLSAAFTEGTTVKAGYGSTPVRDISLGYAADPGGNLVGNILNNDANLGSNRAVSLDVIQQIIPAVKVTASVVRDNASAKLNNPSAGVETSSDNDTTGYQLAAQFATGAISLSGAYQHLKSSLVNSNSVTSAASDGVQNIVILGASYDLSVVKLFGEHARINNDTTISSTVIATGVITMQPYVVGNGTRTYTSAGVQVPFGPVTTFAQISTGTVERVTTTGNMADSRKISGASLGAKYNLSKATLVYASYGKTDMKAGTVDPAAAGIKVTQFAMGLWHSF